MLTSTRCDSLKPRVVEKKKKNLNMRHHLSFTRIMSHQQLEHTGDFRPMLLMLHGGRRITIFMHQNVRLNG